MSALPRALFNRVFLLVWAGYIALAQPGVPACWLEAHACEFHVHFSQHHAETPHSHSYLFDLANAQGAPGLSPLLIPVGLLIALLFNSRFFRMFGMPVLAESSWKFLGEPPPPRFLHSS
jgi:hypothetical protein